MRELLINFARVITFVGALITGLANGYSAYLERDLPHYPHQPDPRTARTAPYQWKGIVVFVTEKELNALNLSFRSGFFSMLLCLSGVIVLVSTGDLRLNRKRKV